MEGIVDFIVNLFGSLKSTTFGRELIVFIISMMPILELRGGIIAARILQLGFLRAYGISIVGNVIPVPFILLFITKILEWMGKSKTKWVRNLAQWVHKKADKHKGPIEKYGYIGLILFVGIPLPGTGAWTGCLIASLLGLNRKKSFLCTLIGILMASVIMATVVYGIF